MQYVDSALDDDVDARLAAWLRRELRTASALTLRTGFYSSPALDLVSEELDALLARGGHLLAVLGGDLLQVDVAALRALLDLCRRHPDNAQAVVVGEAVFQNAKTYHLTHAGGRATAWVGSANFTLGGMAENLEAAVTLASDEDDPSTLERIRAGTLAAARLPTAMTLGEELIEQFERRLRESRFGFGRASLGPTAPLISGHGPALLEQLDRIAAGDHRLLMTSTGFPDLDNLLDGGLRPGTLTVVASRPGAGRSTLVLNILSHAAYTDHLPTALFTFDTSAPDVLLRVLSAQTGINISELRRSRMSDTDSTSTADRMMKLADHEPLHVNAGAPPHLEGLCAAITAATAQQNLALVAVDPLSAVLARTFADNREREIADVVRRLKALAMELQLALIVTAELGRQVDYADYRPGLGDLRDSDVLGQVADHVILLHGADRPDRNGNRPDPNCLTVAKNRHGRRGAILVIPQLSVARFHPARWPAPHPTAPTRPPTPIDSAALPQVAGTAKAKGTATTTGTATTVAASAAAHAAPSREIARRTRPGNGGVGPDGLVVADGGGKTRIHTTGQGIPTVVCLGRADPAEGEWAELHTRLDGLSRLVHFDRPGSAVGDPLATQIARGLGSIHSATTQLDDLLWQAKVPPPYVLVASSIGCWIADQYAVREPRKVTGVVMIDPVNLTPWPISTHRPSGGGNDGETGYLQKPSQDSYVELARSVPTEPRRTVVISSADGRWQRQPPASVTEWTPDALAETDQLWQTFQRDWARRTRARHVIANTAGHLVHRDQPDLVAHIVTAVVEASRAKKTLRLERADLQAHGGHFAPTVGDSTADRPSPPAKEWTPWTRGSSTPTASG